MPRPQQDVTTERGNGYGSGAFGHDRQEEEERLALIEEEQDPYTTARIESFGIRKDWRCLEVGAGKGSMAYWLALKCPEGEVVATDLDTRLLDASRMPNVTVLKHDIETGEFPADSFDLIHARAVLTHVRAPQEVCNRMAGWLRPGGWLLITDPASFTVHSSPHPLMRKVAAASEQAMRQMIGTDPNWARTYPAPLARAGLVEVDAESRLRMMRGGEREAKMFELMLRQIGPMMAGTGLVDEAEVEELRRQLLDPSFLDFPPAVMRAWGRRPGGTGPQTET